MIDERRFLENVHAFGINSCWEWAGHHDNNGYGLAYVGGRKVDACRMSALVHGLIDSIDAEVHVLNNCGNRKCVNPRHLEISDCIERIKPDYQISS